MSTKVSYRFVYGRVKVKNTKEFKLDKKGKAPVVIEAYQNPNRRYFPTGTKLKPGEWNDDKKQVKGNPMYNVAINRQKAALEDFELRFPSIHGRPFTLNDFDLMKDQDEQIKPKKRLSFSAFALQQIERKKAQLSYSAYTRYNRTVGKLVAFNGGQPVEFAQLTYTFVSDFDYYLRTEKDHEQNTICNEHKVIKDYLTRAAHMDLVKASKNPYLFFKLEKETTSRDVLYPAEIARIEQLTFTADQQWLEIYRDAFLFSIYSLLRISDVTDVRQRDLTVTNEGLLYEKTSKKTRKTNPKHRLPFYDLHKVPGGTSKPEQVLLKYARTDSQPLFDRSHPKLNEHIKTIMIMAGITKKVTFHTARHSGITWLVILGLELPIIQQLAQHSNITTTMQYVHLAEHITGEQLSRVDWAKTKRNLE